MSGPERPSNNRIRWSEVRIWLFGPRKATLFSRLAILVICITVIILAVRSFTESSRTSAQVDRVVPAAVQRADAAFCVSTSAQITSNADIDKILQLLIDVLNQPNPDRPLLQQQANRRFIDAASAALHDEGTTNDALKQLRSQIGCVNPAPTPPKTPVSLPPVPSPN